MAYFLPPLLLVMLLVPIINADPDPLQDFCVADTTSTFFTNGFPCLHPNKTSAKHFTTSILSTPGNISSSQFGAAAKATTPQALPGMNTLGLSMVRADFAVGGLVNLHTHPRASEIIFVLAGTLNAGFVDTNNKLFSARLKAGDVFVFPRGVIHFVYNIGNTSASLIAAFNSQAPGTQVIPLATFATNPAIPRKVLAKSFMINVTEVDKIRKNLGGS